MKIQLFYTNLIVFDPLWVFQTCFASACTQAFHQCVPEFSQSYCADILALFSAIVQSIQAGTDSATLRLEFLCSAKYITDMKTNLTCFGCLGQEPEHLLSCGHSFCDNCLLIFATGLPGAEYHFKLDTCLWCHQQVQFISRVKPPPAGIRVISVDGGGTRGAVPLESLCLLQTLLGDLPLRECFDLALGTSSGKRAW
jgi:hypothetical protein